MNYRKLGGFVLLGLLVVCGIWILFRDYVIEKADSQAELTDLSASYTASDEIAAAAQRLSDGVKPAEVVTRLLDDSTRVAIVFDGLPERPLAERLLDVLQKHNASAVFFVEGQNAAEQPETIRRIYDTGYEIGNYTFVGISGAGGGDRLCCQRKCTSCGGVVPKCSGCRRICCDYTARQHYFHRTDATRRSASEGYGQNGRTACGGQEAEHRRPARRTQYTTTA